LCVGFDRLTKRPRARSVRFKAQAGAATVAAVGVAASWLALIRALRGR